MSIFYKLQVKEIRRETVDAVSVVFEIPENLEQEFQFDAGQYVTIQTELEGSQLRRTYSICSSPSSDELRVAIKEVDKGRFSNYANRKMKVGSTLEVAGPEGRFVLNTSPEHKKNYMAFAAGSGITPVISMIKAVLEEEKGSRFVLVYGSKSSDKTIFKQELDALKDASDNRLEVIFIYSQIISDNALFGRIDAKLVKDLFKKQYADTVFDQYFLCGPEEMIDTVKDVLLHRNVKEDDIKFELFSSTSYKKEIKKSLSGNSIITIVLDDEETSFEMRGDELILDAALAKGLDAPYSCQGGVCSSCLAKVIEGAAEMEKNTILDEDEVAEGLILTCQAHPTTPNIKIDFDDV